MRGHTSSTFIRRFGALLAAVGMLVLPALWNGQPIFYPDTPTYLRGAETGVVKAVGPNTFEPWLSSETRSSPADTGPANTSTASDAAQPRLQPLTSLDDKIVLAGRSVYYGALLYLSYLAGGMWLTVIAQALAASWLLRTLMVGQWGARERTYLLTIAALVALTPLGIYAGFLMPDIFAPLVILSAGALAVYWRSLTTSERWIMSGILLFGLCAHASHVALLALVLVVLLGLRFLASRWRGLSLAGLAVVAASLAGALAAEWAFDRAVTRAVGAPPLRLPHPMGRLIDLGPGTDFLRASCPQSGYAACAFVGNFPTAWDDFLFSTDPAKGAFALADAATKRRLSNEQLRFVVDVVKHDPVGVVTGVGANIGKQMVSFRVDLWNYGENAVAKFYADRVPDDIYQGLQQSRAAQPSPLDAWQTVTTYLATAGGLTLLVFVALRRRGASGDVRTSAAPANVQLRPMPFVIDPATRMRQFATVVVLGVGANAIVCATLASSLDRFGARVIWLIPFIGFSAALLLQSQPSARRASASSSPSASLSGASASPSSHKPLANSSNASLKGNPS